MNVQGYGHVFSQNPLNRGEKERRDEAHLTRMSKDPSSLFVPMRDLNLLINTDAEPSLEWVDQTLLNVRGISEEPIFLGIYKNRYRYAIEVSNKEYSDKSLAADSHLKFVDVRTCGEILSDIESGIAAQARMQMLWHKKYKFCSVCGSENQMKRGGQARKCTNCGSDHFPRTDPVIIVVVHDGDRCLLGQSRGRLQNTNTYSALAGFVDQGESIEEAVAREVMEEAGIEVKNVKYHSSQPWPLPYSLMIGCHAEAATTEIKMDPEEMTDVKWFSREEVIESLNKRGNSLKVPMQIAIAHHLIKTWAYSEGN